jgi:hypothetical protein
MNIRRTTLATLALAAASLTACSSESTRSADSTAHVGETTSVATSEVPGTTSPVTVAPAATEPVTTAPATTLPTATVPATVPPATAPPATAPLGFGLYDQMRAPGVPSGHTDPPAPSGALGDGEYWVAYVGGETMTPTIQVYQAFFGSECETQAVAAGEECLNDIYIPANPFREINDLPFAADVYLTVADSSTQLSYWITPDELRIARSSSPSAPAPAGYGFVPFPWKMKVQAGKIVKFEQIWVP